MSRHNDYGLVQRPTEGLAVIDRDGDRALWARRKLRKRTRCAATDAPLNPGDLAYGPVGNQQYRSERILASVIEGTNV